MPKLTFLLLIILGWLQHSLWFGKNGINNYFKVKKEIEFLENSNFIMKEQNNFLLAEINDLNHGYEAIEELARDEIGMIKSNECFYRIVK